MIICPECHSDEFVISFDNGQTYVCLKCEGEKAAREAETPKWHGWATPEQVKKMMREMALFLSENGYAFIPLPFDNVLTIKIVKRDKNAPL